MTIWQNIRLSIVAEHGIIVVEHLFLFFITQHSYLYVGRTLFLFFMKKKTRGSFWRTFWLGGRNPLGIQLDYDKIEKNKQSYIGDPDVTGTENSG